MHSYQKPVYTVEGLSELSKFNEQTLTERNLFKALGTFWEDYYPDLDVLTQCATGALVLQSDEYQQLISLSLASRLLSLPLVHTLNFKLTLIREDLLTPVYDENEDLKYYKIGISGINDIKYIVSSLFEPDIILESGKDYEIVDGELRFYVDLFNDPEVFDSAYRSTDIGTSHIVLWFTDTVVETSWVYDRFGTFLYQKEPDSSSYKWLITSLLYFFVNTKSIKRIEAMINILFGAPFSYHQGEVVERIQSGVPASSFPDHPAGSAVDFYTRITTDRSVYYAPFFFTVLVTEGQRLGNYQLLARFSTVDDYTTDPEWFDGTIFPAYLVESIDYPDAGNEITGQNVLYFDGENNYHGDNEYNANYISFEDWKGNFSEGTYPAFIPYKTDTGLRGRLYGLIDNILKYNLLYLKTRVSFDTYDFFLSIKDDFLEAIRTGMPVYINTLIDTSLEVAEASSLESSDAYKTTVAQKEYPDLYFRKQGQIYYDRNYRFNGIKRYNTPNRSYSDINISRCTVAGTKEDDYLHSMPTWPYSGLRHFNGEVNYGESSSGINNALHTQAYSVFSGEIVSSDLTPVVALVSEGKNDPYYKRQNDIHYDAKVRFNGHVTYNTPERKAKDIVSYGLGHFKSDEYGGGISTWGYSGVRYYSGSFVFGSGGKIQNENISELINKFINVLTSIDLGTKNTLTQKGYLDPYFKTQGQLYYDHSYKFNGAKRYDTPYAESVDPLSVGIQGENSSDYRDRNIIRTHDGVRRYSGTVTYGSDSNLSSDFYNNAQAKIEDSIFITGDSLSITEEPNIYYNGLLYYTGIRNFELIT